MYSKFLQKYCFDLSRAPYIFDKHWESLEDCMMEKVHQWRLLMNPLNLKCMTVSSFLLNASPDSVMTVEIINVHLLLRNLATSCMASPCLLNSRFEDEGRNKSQTLTISYSSYTKTVGNLTLKAKLLPTAQPGQMPRTATATAKMKYSKPSFSLENQQQLLNDLTEKISSLNWKEIAEVTLEQIMFFTRWREGGLKNTAVRLLIEKWSTGLLLFTPVMR